MKLKGRIKGHIKGHTKGYIKGHDFYTQNHVVSRYFSQVFRTILDQFSSFHVKSLIPRLSRDNFQVLIWLSGDNFQVLQLSPDNSFYLGIIFRFCKWRIYLGIIFVHSRDALATNSAHRISVFVKTEFLSTESWILWSVIEMQWTRFFFRVLSSSKRHLLVKNHFFSSARQKIPATETVRPSWRSKSFSQSAKVAELSARHVGVTIGFKRLLSPHHYIPLKYIIVSFSPIDVFEIFRKQTRK